jgi:type IV pilus assembly protein PilO
MQALGKLKQRDIALIAIVLTVLLLIMWYFFMFQKVQDDIQAKNTELEGINKQLQDAQAAVASLPTLRQAVKELKDQKEAYLRRLPKAADLANVIDEVRNNIDASQADLTSIGQTAGGTTAVGGVIPAGVQPIVLNLGLNGKFDSIYRVLQSIEKMQRFTTLNTLDLTMGSPESFDPVLAVKLSMTVYTFDSGATAPAAVGTDPNAATATPAPAAPPATGGRS